MLTKSNELIQEASKQLIDIQKGNISPIRTGIKHLDDTLLGGIFGGQIIVIGAGTGVGKSYFSQRIEEGIFNEDLNVNHKNNILIRCNWEMSSYNLLIRRLSRELQKPIKDIISCEFSEHEKEIANNIVVKERDERILYSETPLTPEQFNTEIREFASKIPKDKNIIITIDHIALVKEIKDGKKSAMDSLIEVINVLRKDFKNMSFIILSQLNREIEKRMDDPRKQKPLLSDIHNSSTIAHIADVVIVLTNPYLQGVEKYLVINTKDERYSHLSSYFINKSNKTTNLMTQGLLYYFYLKVRQRGDTSAMKDIFAEEINCKNIVEKQQEIQEDDDWMIGGGFDFQ